MDHGVGTETHNTKVTCLGVVSYGAELCDPIQCGAMAPSFAIQFSVAIDVEVMWHHLGTTDVAAELGAIGLGAEALPFIFLYAKYISRIVLEKMQTVCSSSDGEGI